MSKNDSTVMKTSIFGGFKKADVLKYVEELQQETSNIQEQLDEKRNEALELKNKIDELEIRLENLAKTNEKLLEKERECAELNVKLDYALKENKEFSDKIAEFQEKSDKIKKAEMQLGAAYIDARRYSDEIVDNARAKAKDIGAIACQDIKREASEIEQLLKEVDVISRKFNSSLEQIHKDVYALGNKLNSSASSLLNIHTDLTGIEAHNIDFDIDVPDDAVRVERTNDDSGLTYISYEPNTEFNADLNIQPDSFDFKK